MPITTITPVPSRTAGLPQDVFSAQMESTLNTMKAAVDDINANASQYNVATSTTSTSSVLIGTGAKTFTVPAALGFVIGMTLRIANTSANFMTGEVTSYVGTTLIVNVTAVGGSGTLASWNISMAAVGASTAASVSNTPAGNISSTTVQGAINELDSEKLSTAAGAVTDTNLSTIKSAETVGTGINIPVITTTSKGRVTSTTTTRVLYTPNFTSADQAVTYNSSLSVAHGLGVKPSFFTVSIKFTTSEMNYSIGDEILMASYVDSGVRGLILSADATNITIVNITNIILLNKTTLASATPTASAVRWVVRAWV